MPAIRALFAIALTLFLAPTGAAAPGAATAPAAPAASGPLDGLSFLLGTWTAGANAGVHGTGAGSTTFGRSLQGRVIVRTNHAEYPASGDRPATKHDDLMVIYAAGGGAPEADYYDNEGHKIHYTIAVPDSNHVVFLGDTSDAGPRFRLTYSRRDETIVDGRFEMAPPGHPDAFQDYLHWEMHRPGNAAHP
jgi:hypothetical protein